jgi:hypothetical protein
VPEPWKWQLSDIDRMIEDRVQESLVLDYKASGSLSRDSKPVSELTKDVSAFANSEGGALVYGVTQDKDNYPLALDVGSDKGTISAEWMSQIIDSRISPRIRGYRIHAIDLPTGKALFVVYVPQAETAHMADDNRYYRRSDCRSVPMEAYEVLDVMGRSKAADFRLDLRLASGGTKLFVYGENFSSVPVPYYVVYLYLGEGTRASHPNLGAPDRCAAELQGPGTVMCDAFQVRMVEGVPLMQGIQIDILQGTAITLIDLPAFLFFAWETITPGRVNRQGYHGTYSSGHLAGQPIPLAPEKWSIQRPRPGLRRS